VEELVSSSGAAGATGSPSKALLAGVAGALAS
jgi:hypothetical protein